MTYEMAYLDRQKGRQPQAVLLFATFVDLLLTRSTQNVVISGIGR
jgi:hypothetical protein